MLRRKEDTLLPRRGSMEVRFVDIGRCRLMNLVLIILLLLLLFGGGGGYYYGGPAVGGGIGGILLIVLIIYLLMGKRGKLTPGCADGLASLRSWPRCTPP